VTFILWSSVKFASGKKVGRFWNAEQTTKFTLQAIAIFHGRHYIAPDWPKKQGIMQDFQVAHFFVGLVASNP
jgi:hypothetical protein